MIIHPLSDVQSKDIGPNTRIWQFVVILPGAKIGAEANICSHCLIENDVVIGDRVTVKSGVQLWDGLRISNDVFIGANVAFVNKKDAPGSPRTGKTQNTMIDAGVTIHAGATILPGLRLGRNAMIGAGAVVTRSVPPNAIVIGNPARIVGYVDAGSDRPGVHHGSAVGAPGTVYSSKVQGVSLLTLPLITDIRGNLSVGEFQRSIPFEAKRYFMVFDVPSVETRGEHAHRECHQFLICVRGRVSVVADDGVNREEFLLDQPNLGLHLPPMVWGIQYKYSADALLLVFASHYYDAEDYVRDYNEFLNLVRAGNDTVS